MFRSLKIILVVMLLAVIMLVGTPATQASAAGMVVEPTYGVYETTFTATADSFGAGERVATWLTLPNLKTVDLGLQIADGGGRVKFAININRSWSAGEFIAVAHGLNSHRELFAKFNVIAPPSEQEPEPPLTWLPDPQGLTLYYNGSGYGKNELVAAWFHSPNGLVQALPNVYADGAGNLSFPFTVQKNWPYGGYHISAQGLTTKHVTYNTFSYFGTITDHRVNQAAYTATSFPDWRGEYFDNQWLSGTPRYTVNDWTINMDWGVGAAYSGMPADHFSVRWTRNQHFDTGTYRFTATADDGIRVWVGGTLLIDEWHDQGPTTHTADIWLSGTYALKVEYYENSGGAQAHVGWSLVTPTPGGIWKGQYYNNPWLAGAPVWQRNDADVNFNWLTGSPGSGIPPENFSVKWDAVRVTQTSGTYAVQVTSDDGARVWVDGHLIIDAWHDQASTTHTATTYLIAGSHNWHVEYYEHTGGAEIHLQIAPAYAPPPAPPSGDIIVDDRGVGWSAGGSTAQWHTAGGYSGDSLWTYTNGFMVPQYNWARWSPALPQARNYEVFAYVPGGTASTRNARYWVAHAGAYNLVVRAQALYPNRWVSLGTYYFNARGGENVSLSDVTYERHLAYTVAWDAVKFSPR